MVNNKELISDTVIIGSVIFLSKVNAVFYLNKKAEIRKKYFVYLKPQIA